jgi:hypothetical protein
MYKTIINNIYPQAGRQQATAKSAQNMKRNSDSFENNRSLQETFQF